MKIFLSFVSHKVIDKMNLKRDCIHLIYFNIELRQIGGKYKGYNRILKCRINRMLANSCPENCSVYESR